MIPLSSGELAGISNIRAHYHALRLNRVVEANTSHRDLYSFVDIVIKPDRLKSMPYKPSFLFSGYTLADIAQLRWSASDRQAFSNWIRQEQQIREIDQVRNRLGADQRAVTEKEYDYPDNLYSCLKNRLELIAMHRASPEQWRKTLINMTRSGIREEELTWSGLLTYLDHMKQEGCSALTQDQLLAQIDFSIIRLSLTNEIVTDQVCRLDFMEIPTSRSINHSITPRTLSETSDCCVLRYVDPVHYYKVGYLKRAKGLSQRNTSQQWFALDSMGNPIGDEETKQHHFTTKEQAFSSASRHALQHLGVPVDYRHHSRYEHKTLYGGSDYREWLLSLPDYPLSHFTSHYYTRNLLVHFRTKERIDSQGRRLLFIEEIQSDWHQNGAMFGYQNRWPGRITPAPFRREWLNLAMKLLLMHGAEHDFDAIAWTRGEIQESHYFKKLSAVKRLYDNEIPRALGRLCGGMGLTINSTRITTKEPRLQIARHWDKWFLTDETGSFSTRPRYTQQEAMQVFSRHCKQIDLEVPLMLLTKSAKQQIKQRGFPLFGEKTVI
jgi:hypothetical protein